MDTFPEPRAPGPPRAGAGVQPPHWGEERSSYRTLLAREMGEGEEMPVDPSSHLLFPS